MDQGHRQSQPLLHTAREAPHVASPFREPDTTQRSFYHLSRWVYVAQSRSETQCIQRIAAKENWSIRNEAKLPPRGCVVKGAAQERSSSRTRQQKSSRNLHRRRLAGSIRAH